MSSEERKQLEQLLRTNLNQHASLLEECWKSVSDQWGYEDPVYRFYSQSFKVYRLQKSTIRMVELLQSLLPTRSLHPWFLKIVQDGTGKEFSTEDNARWLETTRPILEAFQHSRYFIEMACRYQNQAEESPNSSGWASLLFLYQLW